MEPLSPLVAALLASVPIDLATEDSAIALVIRHRWPQGPRCLRCNAPADVICCCLRCRRCGRIVTIFAGTPLGHLRRPRVRALLLAMRAIAVDKRGIAARALARVEDVPHVTLWRHIHILRDMLAVGLDPAPPAALVQVCGRRGTAMPGAVVVARDRAFALRATARSTGARRSPVRLVGETVRTWLNGTFHGVSRNWLSRYVLEATVRLNHDAQQILEQLVRTF
jgi:hypothetical protein